VIKSAFAGTTVLFLALVVGVASELAYLMPYRAPLAQAHGGTILFFALVTFVNLFAAVYVVGRRVLFKDAGQKLRQLDKELKTRTFDVVEE